MNKSMDLESRMEGSACFVTANDVTYSYRHPTGEQVSAAMALAGVDPAMFMNAENSEGVSLDVLRTAGKMARAYELLGAYCVFEVKPRPKMEEGAKWRERDELGLICLSEDAQMALDPILTKLGGHLLSLSNVSKEEGKD